METLRQAVDQAAQHGLIPPRQYGVLQSGFERWDASGRPEQAPGAWLVGLGLARSEVEQLMLWRSHQGTSGSGVAPAGSGSTRSGSTLAAYLRAGPLAKASRAKGARLGPYLVERELARGGMGVVFVAHHEPTGRKVALKTMILGAKASEEGKQRFSREAETAARLDHPGLVKVMGAGEEDGLAWLALEFIEGATLQESLKTSGTRQLVKQLEAAARALGHAHAEGVVHRDIKPQNILVDPKSGRVVVTDFGLVKDLEQSSDLTKTGQAVGTPYYMAPEQVVGEQPTPATDVYSLGVILYQILTGTLPFSSVGGIALFAAIRMEEPATVESLRPDASRGLANICRMAMAKAPAERYPDGAALADDLEAWLGGRTGGVAPARGPLIPLLVVGVAVLVVLLGLLMRRRGPDVEAVKTATPAPTATPLPTPDLEPEPGPTPTPSTTAVQPPAGGAGVDRAEAIRRADALLAQVRGRTAGDPELAKAEQAVGIAPFYGKARWYRGRLLALRKQSERALSDLRAADKVAVPFSGPGLYELRGKLLYDTKNFAEALPDMQRNLRRRPRDGQLAFSYALCLRAARRTDEAIRAFEKMLQIQGKQAGWQVHYNLAGCYMEAERWEQSERAYRVVLARIDYIFAYYHLGVVYRKLGKPEVADALFAKAAGRHGQSPKFLLEWGRVRLAAKRFRGAETLARKLIPIKASAGAYLILARALVGQGRRVEAIGALRGAPAKITAHDAVKALLRELGAD